MFGDGSRGEKMKEDDFFTKLSESVRIGGMTLKNRMVMAPMGTALADKQGLVTEAMKGYYEARAKGGVGMIIVENAAVDFCLGRHRPLGLCIDDERALPGLSELARSIKQYGARATIQLHHAGRMSRSEFAGLRPVAPSAIPAPGGELPREVARDEIDRIITQFANGARMAKKAGFEGVEIHGAHPYLIAQFLSRASNKRLDDYGKSLNHRARLLLQVIEAVREAVGGDFPVWCRINLMELGIDDGLTLDEALEIAKKVSGTSVDALSVSAFGYGKFSTTHLPEVPGAFLSMAQAVKKIFHQPLMAAGRITPEVGEEALKSGKIDIAVLGRALLADPEFPEKILSGRTKEIRPCIHCYVCRDSRYTGGRLRCSVNAATGRENELELKPADRPRTLFVIGGGPAGLEAARVAALRGYRVRLYEKRDRIGGQLLSASVPPHKERIKELIDYFTVQLKKHGVEVEAGQEVTPDRIRDAHPDSVIVATGMTPAIPALPGMDRMNPFSAEQVLEGEVEVGDRVAIIGGGMVGCETAEFLADRGKKVTLVEMLPSLAANMRPTPREKLLDRLAERPVEIFVGARCERLEKGVLFVTDQQSNPHTIPTDTLVFATGAKPDDRLFNSLKDVFPDVHRIGDCLEPRGIREAIAEGMETALRLRP